METESSKTKKEFKNIEIALMAIITPLIFSIIFAASAFISLLASGGTNSGSWLWGPIGLIMMFCIFLGWIFLTRKFFNKYKKIKILFMTAGLAVLLSFLLLWVCNKMNMHHMFG